MAQKKSQYKLGYAIYTLCIDVIINNTVYGRGTQCEADNHNWSYNESFFVQSANRFSSIFGIYVSSKLSPVQTTSTYSDITDSMAAPSKCVFFTSFLCTFFVIFLCPSASPSLWRPQSGAWSTMEGEGIPPKKTWCHLRERRGGSPTMTIVTTYDRPYVCDGWFLRRANPVGQPTKRC